MTTSKITIYETNGRIRAISCCPEGLESLVTVGDSWIRSDADIDNQYVVNGVLVNIPASPNPIYTFDYSSGQWLDARTLAGVQLSQWELIKASRDAAINAGFTWNSMQFQSDIISQNRIMGAVQLAQIATSNSQPFSIIWTLADNSTATLSAADMINVGLALGAFIQLNYTKGATLRNEINAATTIAAVENITWN